MLSLLQILSMPLRDTFLKRKEQSCPWIDAELKIVMNRRDKIFQKHVKRTTMIKDYTKH